MKASERCHHVNSSDESIATGRILVTCSAVTEAAVVFTETLPQHFHLSSVGAQASCAQWCVMSMFVCLPRRDCNAERYTPFAGERWLLLAVVGHLLSPISRCRLACLDGCDSLRCPKLVCCDCHRMTGSTASSASENGTCSRTLRYKPRLARSHPVSVMICCSSPPDSRTPKRTQRVTNEM